jgi:hypothetical protein
MRESLDTSELGDASTPLGAIAREVSKEATLGFQDAVRIESREQKREAKDDGEVLAALGETADATLNAAPWLLWSLLVLVLASLGLGGYLLVQHRRDHRKVRAVSEALSSLDHASSGAHVRAAVGRALGQT